MTQALNLANFANNLNTGGATSNAGLQNSSVTVTAGTAMSGGGAVSLGGSVTLNNAGVTSVVAGTGISVSGATGAVTISSSGGAGTVTSVATGNGLSGGTITTSGTLTVACPTYNTVGSYALGYFSAAYNTLFSAGNNYSAGAGTNQFLTSRLERDQGNLVAIGGTSNNLSGTWKLMNDIKDETGYGGTIALICRVS
jgi:hypothetical protein